MRTAKISRQAISPVPHSKTAARARAAANLCEQAQAVDRLRLVLAEIRHKANQLT
jgi:hypothetical protein